MLSVPPRSLAIRAYFATSLTLIAAYPLLPVLAQDADYVLVSLGALPAVLSGFRQARGGYRWPWWFLAGAVSAFVGASVSWFCAVHGPTDLNALLGVYPILGLLGKLLMLSGVINIVVRRGRTDVGGILDTTIVSMTAGFILWDFVLLPHMRAADKGLGAMATMLVSLFVLAGVLGALIRLLQTAKENNWALWLLTAAQVFSLAATVIAELFAVPIAGVRAPWADMMFMAAFTAVGGVGLDKSTSLLVQAGPTPDDNLTTRRLAFLGAALASIPIIGGGREILGQHVDGLLLAVGGAVIVPLVMARVGRLSAQRARAERALLYQATHDALTGLPNRREFVARLTEELSRDHQRVRPLVLFCDLDGFKAVNDRLGHAAGDQLLVEVAARLRRSVREGDMVSRFGGDEFVVLCRDESATDAPAIIARITEEVGRPIEIRGEAVRVGASIGAVAAEARAANAGANAADAGAAGEAESDASAAAEASAEAMIQRADSAMYEAKQRRRTTGGPVSSAVAGGQETRAKTAAAHR